MYFYNNLYIMLTTILLTTRQKTRSVSYCPGPCLCTLTFLSLSPSAYFFLPSLFYLVIWVGSSLKKKKSYGNV